MGAARNVIRGQPSEYEEDRELPHVVFHFMYSSLQWSTCCVSSAVEYAHIASCS
jgi:hypothetical protein